MFQLPRKNVYKGISGSKLVFSIKNYICSQEIQYNLKNRKSLKAGKLEKIFHIVKFNARSILLKTNIINVFGQENIVLVLKKRQF